MSRQQRPQSKREALAMVRRIIAGLGVMMILAGLAIGFGAGRMGVDPGTARLVSSVLIIAGVVDLITAMVWDKLFGTGR